MSLHLLKPVHYSSLFADMKQILILATFAFAACATQPGPVKRQMVGLLEKFDRWDYNGDGQLNASELQEAEQVSGIPSADIIAFYDTSKNGRISLSEVQAGLLRVDEARENVDDIHERR